MQDCLLGDTAGHTLEVWFDFIAHILVFAWDMEAVADIRQKKRECYYTSCRRNAFENCQGNYCWRLVLQA